jgi:general secretion pathway protein I
MIRRLSQRRTAGFTLVEVMFALAILAGALILLLQGAAANVASTQRSQMLSAATELARGKMYDIEEKLLEEGFQNLDQTEEGDFDDEGWEQITWEAEITKIKLPNLGAMKSLGAEGEEGAEGEDSGGGMLGGMLGGFGGDDGGAGAGLIGSQFELFRSILEESIRKVHLTIRYKVAGSKEEFTVDCYFTEPHAVNRVINLGPGAANAGDEDAADGSSTSGSSTSGSNTGSNTGNSTSSRNSGSKGNKN